MRSRTRTRSVHCEWSSTGTTAWGKVRKGIYSGVGSAALIVMAYTGEAVGSPVSDKRSLTSRSGLVFVPLSEGLAIRVRVKLMRTPLKDRVYVNEPSQNKYVRAWASPTLPAVVDVYDTGPTPPGRVPPVPCRSSAATWLDRDFLVASAPLVMRSVGSRCPA